MDRKGIVSRRDAKAQRLKERKLTADCRISRMGPDFRAGFGMKLDARRAAD